MSPAGFETAIPTNEQPQTHALDRAATGIGCAVYGFENYSAADLLCEQVAI